MKAVVGVQYSLVIEELVDVDTKDEARAIALEKTRAMLPETAGVISTHIAWIEREDPTQRWPEDEESNDPQP